MFNKKPLIGALVSIVSSTSFANDSEISYTYGNLEYNRVSIPAPDFRNIDFDGINLSGSAAINESIFVLGRYTLLELDEEDEDGFTFNDLESSQL